MTFNIVAQFSSSVWKNKEHRREGYVEGGLKEYPVVSGSIFNEEYSEILDSATIVLSQVRKEDRLINIKPYDYVRVYDKTGQTGFDKLYLVDNYNEVEKNVTEHIFGYSINLMSETKWLEKFQCPNLAITHKVNEDGSTTKKTIFQHIKQYMELYVPKMKYSNGDGTWSYKPIITLEDAEDNHEDTIVSETYTSSSFSRVNTFEYEFKVEIVLNNSNITNFDSVEVENYVFEGTYPVFDQLSVYFSRADRKFHVYGRTTGTVFTSNFTITINYTYKTLKEKWKKFDIGCADMGFTAPTLRQLLTTLMQQVGCIPIVVNRKLSFLDFQKESVPFGNGDYTIDNTVNSIRRGLSSDSYVNTLVNISDSVLDSGNQVVCEALGFRDIENVLLKQQENLYLETQFPIYKVENFAINAYCNVDMTVQNFYYNGEFGPAEHTATWLIFVSKPSSKKVKLDFTLTFQRDQRTSLTIDGTLVGFKYKASEVQSFEVFKYISASSFVHGTDDVFIFDLDYDCDKFYFYGRLTVRDETGYLASKGFNVFFSNFSRSSINLLTLYSLDITPLLVESSARQLLSTDFSSMAAETEHNVAATINTLAKYVYGTVGYTIGSKKISGFSDTYDTGHSTVLGWIQVNYTYIENIWNFITKQYQDSIYRRARQLLGNMPIWRNNTYTDGIDDGYTKENIQFNSVKPYNPQKKPDGVYRIFTSDINFSYIWFNIKYQPLNSFNLAYTKSIEDVDIPISQYDSNVSGLTDFDRLSIHEQEQVDRIGNETLTIGQRTDNYNKIQTFENGPLSYYEDSDRSGIIGDNDNGIKYIIFKRTFTINNNCFNAQYIGSKDAVLKDYFTSIRTKYRAYQYVDYNQSTLRKERDTFYVRISENDWYNGDDNIFFSEFTPGNKNKQQRLLLNLLGDWKYTYTNHISIVNTKSALYCVLSDDDVQTKNDISKISHKNFFSIVTEEKDNVGSGTYIANNAFNQALANKAAMLGGVPQSWQIWKENYNYAHLVSYVSNLDIANIFDDYINANSAVISEVIQDFDKVLSLPILDETFVDIHSEAIKNVVFSVVADNKSSEFYSDYFKKVFYKNYAERISYTTQFIYYTDSQNIIWSEYFFKLNNMCGNKSDCNIYLVSLEGQDFELKEGEYRTTGIVYMDGGEGDIITFNDGSSEGTNPFILINWSRIPNITQFKAVVQYYNKIGYLNDVIAFKKGDTDLQKFYVTLNDTKTDYVMSEQNGVLYRKYKVVTNVTERRTEINDEQLKVPVISFNIDQQSFNEGEEDSYSITITNNNSVNVVAYISETNKTFAVPANSTVVLTSTTNLENDLDDVVRYRNEDVSCYFESENLESNSVVILNELTYLSNPEISKDIDATNEGIELTITNPNIVPCVVNMRFSQYESEVISIGANETIVLNNLSSSENYNENFANFIDQPLSDFYNSLLEMDAFCWLSSDYQTDSGNEIILNCNPENPVIINYQESTSAFSFQIKNNNPFSVNYYIKGSQNYLSGTIPAYGESSVIDENSDSNLTSAFNAYIAQQLFDTVYVYVESSVTISSDNVVIWEQS